MTRCLLAVWIAAATAGAGATFQRLGLAGGQAENGIFAADLDGDGKPELIGLGRGRISIYRASTQGGKPYPDPPQTLRTRSAAYFADVADVHPAKGKELVVLTPTGVACFVHEGGRYAPGTLDLLRCKTLLTARPVRGAIELAALLGNTAVMPWNFAFDATGDGRDDLVVPHGDGTDVYVQTQPGKFAAATTLPLFPFVQHTTNSEVKANGLGGLKTPQVSIWLTLRCVERRDVDRDGRPDLVWGRYWFAQKDKGSFDPNPQLLPHFRMRPQKGHVGDINGDGRPDQIVEENKYDDPLNISTHVRVYLADKDGDIPTEPVQTIVSQNILVHTPLPVHDFNNDGALDFAMFKTDITITEVAKWVRQSFGKIDGDLRLWYFDRASNRYGRRAAYEKPIRMRFKLDLMEAMGGLVWERYLSTMMRFEGDYDADGRLDLLVRETTRSIAIYLNTGDPDRLFPKRPDILLEGVPPFGGLLIEDLNGDGASDLILNTPASPVGHAKRSNIIAVYISQRR